MEIISTPRMSYRLRCRFGLTLVDDALAYFVYEGGTQQVLQGAQESAVVAIASKPIAALMDRLLKALNGAQSAVLRRGVEAVHFLNTLHGDMLVTLIYSEPLRSDEWLEAVQRVQVLLGGEVAFVGRSKGQVVSTVAQRRVEERLRLRDGREIRYLQEEGCFTNPNGRVNELCLDWLCDVAADVAAKKGGEECTFLELYCGGANHTCALARYFSRVVAVEISKPLCEIARENLALNGIDNVSVYCMAAALTGGGYDLILVDPPRAGLDESRCLLFTTHFRLTSPLL